MLLPRAQLFLDARRAVSVQIPSITNMCLALKRSNGKDCALSHSQHLADGTVLRCVSGKENALEPVALASCSS